MKDGGHVHVLAAEELHTAESAQEAAGGLGGGAPEAEEADPIGPPRPLGGLGQLGKQGLKKKITLQLEAPSFNLFSLETGCRKKEKEGRLLFLTGTDCRLPSASVTEKPKMSF